MSLDVLPDEPVPDSEMYGLCPDYTGYLFMQNVNSLIWLWEQLLPKPFAHNKKVI